MKKGALAIFDALAFRGIWQRSPAEVVLAKLENLHREALAKQQAYVKEFTPLANEHGLNIETEMLFLSDTVVVATSTTTDRGLAPPDTAWPSIVVTSQITSSIVAMGSLSDPAFAYRGCI